VKAYFAIFAGSIVAAVACGARTGLPVPDGGVEPPDAGPDVTDAPPDAPADAIVPESVCEDAGTTFIYVITEENVLYSFYPPEGAGGFTKIGTIDCHPADPTATPFSMGVDRTGTAYVVFGDGELFAVSTATADCKSTPYVPTPFGSAGQNTFGMGFSADLNDPGETLYVASDDDVNNGPTAPESLGTIDVDLFQLQTVGDFPQIIGSAELTGTGDGRLFAFGVDQPNLGNDTSYSLLELDKTNAGLLSQTPLQMSTGSHSIQAWAFAFWGGKFYFFTALEQGGPSTISIYTPGTLPAQPAASFTITNTIVGAGVSTCAPAH
jgi:hypothetical protein